MCRLFDTNPKMACRADDRVTMCITEGPAAGVQSVVPSCPILGVVPPGWVCGHCLYLSALQFIFCKTANFETAKACHSVSWALTNPSNDLALVLQR